MTSPTSAFAPAIAGYLPKKGDADTNARIAGKDRYGYTMPERLLWQGKQLDYLQQVLTPKVHAKLSAWALKQNKPADPAEGYPGGQHTAPCGMELYQWLLKHGELLSEIN